MLKQRDLARVGKSIEGRLIINFESGQAIRIRYEEGKTVLARKERLIVGELTPPSKLIFKQVVRDRPSTANELPGITSAEVVAQQMTVVECQTPSGTLSVMLDPFRMEFHDKKGQKIFGIGGPEKNFFSAWDSLNTGLFQTASGEALAVESFDLSPGEAVYGFGEKFVKLNKTGQTIDLDMQDALGVTTPRSYKNVPFFLSTNGYGVFVNSSAPMTFWVGSMSATDIQLCAGQNYLDYYVFIGSIKEVIAEYTQLTGRGVVPPDWTFGFWQSKISYSSADETLEIARQFRMHQIPCDVIHLDTHWFKEDWYCDLKFSEERFPDPKAYFEQMRQMGFKVSLWQLPYIPSGSALFAELEKANGFVKSKDGSIYNLGLCFTPGFKGIVGVVDYTQPKAVKIHQDAIAKLFKLGAKVIKTDFGEGAPADGVYADGTPGREMHNLYPLLYNKAFFEVTQKETGDGVVWARSAWAGGQRYPLHWGGDNSPNYENMIPQIEGGLSFGLCGFQFWSQDIGGFCGKTNDELLIRWMQLGMFLSHSRIHGTGDRELYKFKPKTMKICREFIRLRYQLMPYILWQAQVCVDESFPMLRPLVLEYQNDRNVWNIGDQFLFGASILVAPIYTKTGVRDVYLPEGTWYDWWTGRVEQGNRWIKVKASMEQIPLFVPEGGIIPLGPVMNYVGEREVDQIDLMVAPLSTAGVRTAHFKVDGRQIKVKYVYNGKNHVLSIKSPIPVNLNVAGGVKMKVTKVK